MSNGYIKKPIPVLSTYSGSKSESIDLNVDNTNRVISADVNPDFVENIKYNLTTKYITVNLVDTEIDINKFNLLVESRDNKIICADKIYTLSTDEEDVLTYTTLDGNIIKLISINKNTKALTFNEQEVGSGAAKGLYYDAELLLGTKPYWYITSEIDSETGLGIIGEPDKESRYGYQFVISGPYDLGAGGGGGGGSSVTEVIVTNIDPETGDPMWPDFVAENGSCILKTFWSSTKDGQPTKGKGSVYVYVNEKLYTKLIMEQGYITDLDIGDALVSGENKIDVKVVDAYSGTSTLTGSISVIAVGLSSRFNADLNYTGIVNFSYIAKGDLPDRPLEKTMHFLVDDVEVGTQVVTSSGDERTYQFKSLKHGAHIIKAYFTAEINKMPIKSNELSYAIIYYNGISTDPIITSNFAAESTYEQYIPFNIDYRVFTPGKNLSEVKFYVNGKLESTVNVDQTKRYWEYSNDKVGVYNLKIQSGSISKEFKVTIIPTTINVVPVTNDAACFLLAAGKDNDRPDRDQWVDPISGVECVLEGFNWTSNGWIKKADGTVLSVSGGASVTIPYKAFANDFKNSGKTFEIEFSTSVVRNYETKLLSCLDNAESILTDTMLVKDDSRVNRFAVNIDKNIFINKVDKKLDDYVFTYDNGWKLNSNDVSLDDYGITLKLIGTKEEQDYIWNGDKFTVSYQTVGRGIYITPQLAVIRSQQSYLEAQYKEDDHVRISFVIEKNTSEEAPRIMYIYINGVAACAVQYPSDDVFSQLAPKDIVIGSKDANIDIYAIRIYDNSLSRKQVVQNWIADTQVMKTKAERYNRNNNFDTDGKIAIDQLTKTVKGLTTTPYIIWDMDELPQYKGDKRPGDSEYVDPTNDSKNYTSENGQYNVQGTSSSVYPVKNIRIKYKQNKDWPGKFSWLDKDGNKISKFAITEGGIADNYFTYKVDYASSEGANNVELVRIYNDACKAQGILTPPQREDDRVRVGIDGFPVVAFWRHTQDGVKKTEFLTKANFNNDKANEAVYGFNCITNDGVWADGDQSWETTNNTAGEANFTKPITQETFGNAFEIRYPDEDGFDNIKELKKMHDWVYSTYTEEATGQLLAAPRKFKYTNVTRSEDGTYKTSEVTSPEFTHDTVEYRLTKFKAELKDHFNVDSTIFYYIYTHLFLLVDSRAKNAFPTYFSSVAHPGVEGTDRWYWLPYDMDTAIGINNEGKLVFDYNLEDIDQVNGADVFNGQSSTMWVNLRKMFDGEIGKMYSELRTTGSILSFESVDKYFSEHQKQWSENIFNEDAYIKYIKVLAEQNENYLEMLQGSKEQQRRWWLYNRFKYFDSKYLAGDAKKDFIQFRAYVPVGTEKPNIEITPYADIYACASYSNSAGAVVSKRAPRGQKTILENPFGTMESETDQETYIYSASQLASIGDISGFYPDTVKVANAVKLQELKVGDGSDSYRNEHLTELTLGANTLLKTLDVRNCVNLKTSVNLEQCTNIEEIYFENTSIPGIKLPEGGTIRKLHLPQTITNLTIKGHTKLEDLELQGTANIQTLWLEKIPLEKVNVSDIIGSMAAGSAVRIIGIDEHLTEAQLIKFYDNLSKMKGMNQDGSTKDPQGHTLPAQVTGDIYLEEMSYSNYMALKDKYDEVTLHVTNIKCIVKFYNYDVVNYETGEITYKLIDNATQIIILGEDAVRPEDPTFGPTTPCEYEFDHWDTSLENIQKDTDIKAVYNESVRKYDVTFDPNSDIIVVDPEIEKIDYNTFAYLPECKNVPEGVSLDQWYQEIGLDLIPWNFESNRVLSNVHLIAKWNDGNKPNVRITRTSYKTYTAHATDNLGIVAYAVTETPEEPSTWINIKSTTARDFDELFENISGQSKVCYFFVKDSNHKPGETTNIDFDSIASIQLNKSLSEGIENIQFYEVTESGDVEMTSAPFIGTTAKVHVTLDPHYENLQVRMNDVAITNDYEFVVSEEKTISCSCEKKTYTINFISSRGITPETQNKKYKEYVHKPLPQYDNGFYIDGWETEDGTRWDFDNDIVDRNITLTAIWVPYHGTSTIKVNVGANSSFTLNLFQSSHNGVYIDWGDGTTDQREASGVVGFTKSYIEGGEHTITIKATTGYWIPGGGSVLNPFIYPASLLTDAYFSYDVTTFNQGAFAYCSNLTKLKLTEYIVSIQELVFYNCDNLSKIYVSDEYDDNDNIAFEAPISLNIIRTDALRNCGITGKVIFNENLKTIEAGAFNGCRNIIEVNKAVKLETLGAASFGNCTSLESIELSDLLTEIRSDTFNSCSTLKSIVLDENIARIGQFAFNGCSELSSVKILNKNIDTYYEGGSGYESIYGVFSGCPKLKTAGPLNGGYDLEFTIDTKIPNGFFMGMEELTSVVLPDTLEELGHRSFRWTTKLKDITLPYSLRYIGIEAFYNATTLGYRTSFDIPPNVSYIGLSAFAFTDNLAVLNIYSSSLANRDECPRPAQNSESWVYRGRNPMEMHLRRELGEDIEQEIEGLIYTGKKYQIEFGSTDDLKYSINYFALIQAPADAQPVYATIICDLDVND